MFDAKIFAYAEFVYHVKVSYKATITHNSQRKVLCKHIFYLKIFLTQEYLITPTFFIHNLFHLKIFCHAHVFICEYLLREKIWLRKNILSRTIFLRQIVLMQIYLITHIHFMNKYFIKQYFITEKNPVTQQYFLTHQFFTLDLFTQEYFIAHNLFIQKDFITDKFVYATIFYSNEVWIRKSIKHYSRTFSMQLQEIFRYRIFMAN